METVKEILEPLPGFSREIGFYLSAWEGARAQTRKLVEDLSEEEIARRFLPDLHSVGAIALHLGEAEFYWMQFIVARKEITAEDKKFSHWCDTLEADLNKGYTAKYCLEKIDAISQMSRELLAGKTDADLEKLHLRDDSGEPLKLSLRYILQMLVDHEAHHRGQIAMIKRLLRGGKTAT